MKKSDVFSNPKELSVKFIAYVGCMDGRPLLSFLEHVRDTIGHHVWPDTIARPGMDKLGSEASEEQFAELQEQIEISKTHGSKTIYVAGHALCAGNPDSTEEEQKEQTRTLARRMKDKNSNEEVVALWLFPEGDPNKILWTMEVLDVL